MINIFFVPGMFASTIEYILKNHKTGLDVSKILSDGSMHSFSKEAHINTREKLIQNSHIFDYNSDTISTIMYPFNNLKLHQIISNITNLNKFKNILIRAENTTDCELNLLFQYYKIANGKKLNIGMSIFNNPNQDLDVQQWNKNYTSLDDMRRWEYREWFSIFYPSWTEEWKSNSNEYDHFLKISNTQFLNNTLDSMVKISKFCELPLEKNTLKNFLTNWKTAQQYIIEKFKTLDTITTSTINKKDFNWQPMSIIEEAIVQQRLRQNGFEMQCDGLDVFPTNSINLNNLIYKN